MTFVGETRFKADAKADYATFKKAAVDYTSNLAPQHRGGLREKPLDWNPGHASYFTAMFQLLNALQALKLTPGSKIVEVGSGAGWATEILAALAYRITCVEPSPAMIKAAKRRVLSHLKHHGLKRAYRNVTWRCATMEECALPPGEAHAAIFFESFHHVIDENEVLERTYEALGPGGYIVILGDSNWVPGNRAQEAPWVEEMAAYGTLESPFTDQYLLWLLRLHGFTDVARHHMVDALVPVEREREPVKSFVLLDAAYNNLVIARKPGDPHAPDLGQTSRLRRLAARLRAFAGGSN
jgi:SAM-dependent methyltransferase